MRAHPVALHCYDNKDMVESIAKKQALVTHAHKEGWQGAVLQAYAVYLALHVRALFYHPQLRHSILMYPFQNVTDNKEFLDKLRSLVDTFEESETEDRSSKRHKKAKPRNTYRLDHFLR